MTADKVKQVVTKYYGMVVDGDAAVSPKRCGSKYAASRPQALDHVAWMCLETVKLCDEGRTEKAMRWLGFIQGVLWMSGFRSIEDLKTDNMPEGEDFKP